MAMALYPQVQERAFDELDKVLGADQLPTMSDKHRLPYLAAVIKETMRWNPVLPFSAWFIPVFLLRGTIVLVSRKTQALLVAPPQTTYIKVTRSQKIQ